jgi:pyruvate dehydrogenase E2 component (dihydrolipoamide acetyltransferase)
MAFVIEMPKLGVTMEEGRIVAWRKNVGDSVSQGEVLVEVETEKVTIEYESAVRGVLARIIAVPGDIVKVGQPICVFAEAGEDVSNISTGEIPKIDQSSCSGTTGLEIEQQLMINIAEEPKPQQQSDRIKATPVVKKIARQRGVDLKQVTGTGPNGRVLKNDLMAYLELGGRQKQVAASGLQEKKIASGGVKEIIPLTSIRGVIGRRMQESILQAPQGTQFIDVDMTETLRVREILKESFNEQAGVNLTISALIIKAVARALEDHSMLNSVIKDDKIFVMEDINIGIATDIESGLVVPVMKRVQDKSLLNICQSLAEMTDKARQRKLTQEEMSGGTFTISNLGMFGIGYFTPLINLPESAILGVGSIEKKVVVQNDEIVIRPMIRLSLTLDHRSLDGAPAARFFQHLKKLLETPWQKRISDVKF